MAPQASGTRRYGVAPIRLVPFFLIDDSVFADVMHHCHSLEVEQLHLFDRMVFISANSSIAVLRTRLHGPGSPRLTSGLAATGEWLPTFCALLIIFAEESTE